MRLAGHVLIIAGVLAPFALGHGGMFRGPGPGLPGIGGPGGGTGGPAGGAPPTGGGAGPITAVKKARPTVYTDWYTWWKFNRDPWIDLRERLGSRFAVTGVADASVRPSFDELEGAVVPALLRLLEEDDPDIVDSTVLALARVTPEQHTDAVYEKIVDALKHDDRSVKQSAILSLGVLGDRRAVPALLEIVADSSAGRAALKMKRSCDDIQRATAAVALGYLSDPDAIPVLEHEYQRSGSGDADLRAAIVLSLGLFQRDAHGLVRFLGDVVDDGREEPVVRAQAPIALARLGEAARAMIPSLMKHADARRVTSELKQSCVIALGRIAVPEDREVIDLLVDMAQKDNDHATSNFALIALGQIGGAAAEHHTRHGEMLDELQRKLLRQLSRPQRSQLLPFAATACALVGRSYPADHEARDLYGKKLQEALDDASQPEHRSAIAISLGLLDYRESGDELLDLIKRSSDRELNGHIAEALGLMRYEPASPYLLAQLGDDADRAYRSKLAVGLGLMGDRDVSLRLVEEVRDAETLWTVTSLTQALGQVGDRGAIPGLVSIAEDKSRTGLARAFAAVAIGLIGEKTRFPWHVRLASGANYLAVFPAQSEILDIL